MHGPRPGEGHSYVVEIAPGVLQAAHRSQLKPHVEDQYSGDPLPLYYFSGKAAEVAASPEDWTVEAILGHRKGAEGPEFLVRWEKWDPEDCTWEPLRHFFPQFNTKLVDYCVEQGMNPRLYDLVGRQMAVPPRGYLSRRHRHPHGVDGTVTPWPTS